MFTFNIKHLDSTFMSVYIYNKIKRKTEKRNIGEDFVSHFPATTIKYNDIQGPTSKFHVSMATGSNFEQVLLEKMVVK